jgi:hypothetical protein
MLEVNYEATTMKQINCSSIKFQYTAFLKFESHEQ